MKEFIARLEMPPFILEHPELIRRGFRLSQNAAAMILIHVISAMAGSSARTQSPNGLDCVPSP